MRLLAILHGLGLNAALVAGLVLMPAVVATGYIVERVHDGFVVAADLRGSLDSDAGGHGTLRSGRF